MSAGHDSGGAVSIAFSTRCESARSLLIVSSNLLVPILPLSGAVGHLSTCGKSGGASVVSAILALIALTSSFIAVDSMFALSPQPVPACLCTPSPGSHQMGYSMSVCFGRPEFILRICNLGRIGDNQPLRAVRTSPALHQGSPVGFPL
ncbi:hypothetical protein EDC04DRAFT_2699138, partial [Pisolithus marmoratus]